MRSFLSAAVLGAGMMGCAAIAAPAAPPVAIDPPALIGEPYAIDGVTVSPADAPFDDVGLAALDATAAGSAGISMAHRTLPLPSYAEVTALDSGRTILVRVERRGPLAGPAFVALSPGAFAQIGADPSFSLPIRVRRVSPQEYERALLRTGQRAPERLATPKPLLEVLRRRLAERAVPASTDAAPRVVAPVAAAPIPDNRQPLAAPVTKPEATTRSEADAAPGYSVQVAAFSNRAGADATAAKLGGSVTSAGKLWRVRLGPFATRAEAQAALTKARNAGFADARIAASSATGVKSGKTK